MTNGTTRRRSIFSGLLLILIGVLFLLHYHMPQLGIGHLFRLYWPVLFIIWGLAKLYDNLAARHSGQARPPILTGGEIALIFVLFLAAGGLAGVEFLKRDNVEIINPGIWFERPVTSTEEIPVQPVAADSKITVTTHRGNITLRSDETNNVRVVVTKTISEMDEGEARDRAKRITVAISKVTEGYDVRPQGADAEGAKVDLEIHVPKKVSLVLRTDRGDISASSVDGGVWINSSSGDIELRDISGDVNTEMQRGDVRITGVHGSVRLTGRGNEVEIGDVTGEATIGGEFYGPIRVRNVAKTTHFTSSRSDLTIVQLPGRMEMDSGRLEITDTQGGVSLTTKNKDVVLENVAGRIHIEDHHGDIQVQFPQPPKEEINITNDSGEIHLTLPASSNFEIAASSRSGEIQSDFAGPTLKASDESGTSHLDGKVGTHGPQIHLVTSYGTIQIRKGP